MTRVRRHSLTLAAILLSLLVPAAARANAPYDRNGFRLQSATMTVQENAGAAVVTILRNNTSPEAQIRYIAVGITARADVDYRPVKTMIDFQPGQASATFRVPIIDHGVPVLPKTIKISLFGPHPLGLANPHVGILTILGDDLPLSRDPRNPLALPAPPPPTNPLAGAHFFVDYKWGNAARIASAWRRSKPGAASALDVIANEPGAARFGGWNGPWPGEGVSGYLARASVEEPGTVPMLMTYRILGGHCGHWADSPSRQLAYHNWISSFARGVSGYRAVLFLEMDGLITTGCLSRHGVDVRMNELRDAIKILTAHCPRLVVYLDAGAADAVPAGRIAYLLRRAGVGKIQGFFLNSTHFDWTSKEIRFGEQISRMTAGKHFVVNTGENGQGPLKPPDPVHQGNEVLCNPPRRGLGPKPTTNTGYPNVDAFAWMSNPGESGGACVPGAPPTGVYWPAYALMLIHNANFRVR